MKRFYSLVVKLRIPILVSFLVAAGICAVLQGMVAVDYDLNDYLPADSPSTVALDVMEEEFEGGIPNARVMVKDVTIAEALQYKAALMEVDGVSDVMWLDDSMDITVPLEFMEEDTVETYYKDGNALFTVTIEDGMYVSAAEGIRDLIGPDNAMSGNAIATATSTTGTITEVQRITVLAVLFVLLVLILTTTSWLEPLVILVGLGVAIILNAGTNLIFGEISFVSNAAGAVLQLAVSLDYSVFLYHRFEDNLSTGADPEQSMIDALCQSTSSILSSGLTTVIGFLALVFMRFLIGPDLGLVLAKGVAISLIDVFVFMPALFLITYPLLQKTKHRSFVPDMHGFAKLVSKVMIPLALVFALIVVPSYRASNSNSFYYGSSHIYGEGTEYGENTAEIEAIFGKSDTYVVMVPVGDRQQELELTKTLEALPEVKDVISYTGYLGTTVPDEMTEGVSLISKLQSDHYSRMVIQVDADYEGEETFALVESIRQIVSSYYPDNWYVAGQGVSTYDLMDTITADMVKVNLLAIAAVFVVLLLSMRSLVLPVLLVASIETAIWINLSIPYLSGTPIFFIAYLIISSIQLGATVDYAILMTDRYRENRLSMNRKDAVIETISSCTVSILTSGSVLTVVGFLMGYLCTHGLLAQLGQFLGKGTLFSLLIVLFVLPGLLYVFDKVIVRKEAKAKHPAARRIHIHRPQKCT
jgi:hypothetical protein